MERAFWRRAWPVMPGLATDNANGVHQATSVPWSKVWFPPGWVFHPLIRMNGYTGRAGGAATGAAVRITRDAMHISDHIKERGTTFSFEFFPPRTPEAADALFAAIEDLIPLKPSFVSVTYGAGGSTRELTRDLVIRIKRETPLDPIPHLTCVGHREPELREILDRYAQAGVGNIMALRGDRPKDGCGDGDFRYASELVTYVKAYGRRESTEGESEPAVTSSLHPDSRGFGVGVAGYPEGHPETPNRMLEMDRLKAKVDAGADFIVTQLFFDNRDFYDFRDRCELAGIRVPILAGIMPITSADGMRRMAELALGARYPAPLVRAINRTGGNPDGVRRVGVHWATEQCRDLLDHQVAGIHFYTLNRSTATREIYTTLGVADSTMLANGGGSGRG